MKKIVGNKIYEYCHELLVTSVWNVMGVAEYAYGKMNDIDVKIEDIESEDGYETCLCDCVYVQSHMNLRGMTTYNYAQISDANILMQKIRNNNIYGMGYYNYSAGNVSGIDVLMQDVQANSVYGLAGSQYRHAKDLNIAMHRTMGNIVVYGLVNSVGSNGRLENVRLTYECIQTFGDVSNRCHLECSGDWRDLDETKLCRKWRFRFCSDDCGVIGALSLEPL